LPGHAGPAFSRGETVKKDLRKENPRRLMLNRETIRQLDEVMLQGIAGGATITQPGLDPTSVSQTQATWTR
jgi:hypothetical protein